MRFKEIRQWNKQLQELYGLRKKHAVKVDVTVEWPEPEAQIPLAQTRFAAEVGTVVYDSETQRLADKMKKQLGHK